MRGRIALPTPKSFRDSSTPWEMFLRFGVDTYTEIRICVFRKMRARNAEPAFLFKALSDPTRLRLLNLLGCGETCVCELTDTLRVVQPKVSRHLAHLKRAGLVEACRNGKWMLYRWAKHADPLVRHVLAGLRGWMETDEQMNGERLQRQRVCCRFIMRKTKGTKNK